MQWKDITKQQPVHGQRILVYHQVMQPYLDEFLIEGIWPMSRWNEIENSCQDEDGTLFKISLWTEFSLPAEVRIETFREKN